MKLNEIKNSGKNLIGMTINGKVITDKNEKWKNEFTCANMGLTSLEGAPKSVGGSFNCSYNQLTSLEGAPETVADIFICYYNQLTSLEGAPKSVGDYFDCSYNQLTSLEGAPESVGSSFICYGNQLTSLKDIHLQIESIGRTANFEDNPIKSHVLGLLKIKGLKKVYLDNEQVREIINKYLEKGINGLLDAQEELIEAGLEEYAQL